MEVTFDPRPVLPFLVPVKRRIGFERLRVELRVSERALWKTLRGQRIDLDTADKLAIGLGLHPALVWGEDYLRVMPRNGQRFRVEWAS